MLVLLCEWGRTGWWELVGTKATWRCITLPCRALGGQRERGRALPYPSAPR